MSSGDRSQFSKTSNHSLNNERSHSRNLEHEEEVESEEEGGDDEGRGNKRDDHHSSSSSSHTTGRALDEAIRNKPPPMPTLDENKLQFPYSIWFSHKTSPHRPAPANSAQGYEQSIKLLGSFCTVEQFWGYYCHMTRPSDLAGPWDFHVFKYNIKPLWEDEANKDGGKWIVRVNKGKCSRPWESVLLAMLGEQFMVGDEICGVVLSLRYKDDIISVWNRTSSDAMVTARIRDTLRRILNLPQSASIEYKKHTDSLRHLNNYTRD